MESGSVKKRGEREEKKTSRPLASSPPGPHPSTHLAGADAGHARTEGGQGLFSLRTVVCGLRVEGWGGCGDGV